MTSHKKKHPEHRLAKDAEEQEDALRHQPPRGAHPVPLRQPQDDARQQDERLKDERLPIPESDEIDREALAGRPHSQEQETDRSKSVGGSAGAQPSDQLSGARANEKVTPSRTDPRTPEEARLQSDHDPDRPTRTSTGTPGRHQQAKKDGTSGRSDRAKRGDQAGKGRKDENRHMQDTATGVAKRRTAKSRHVRRPVPGSQGAQAAKGKTRH